MVSRQRKKSLSSAAASEASASPNFIENRTMSVSLHFSYPHLANIHAQLIASLLKPMEEHIEDARNEEDHFRLPVSALPIVLTAGLTVL
jgi:hypothetical protein